ncbi:MAG: helix-turn-helix transcriptional regulator [Fusicatenibacter sp.]
MNQIRFVGYSGVHPADFLFDVPSGYDCYLFLLVLTSARFYISGETIECPAGTAILYPPGHPISYGANQTTYENDWLRFSTDEPLVTGFPLTGLPFSVSDPEYCHNLLQLLTWEAALSSDNSTQIISHLIQTLFLRLYEDSAYREHTSHGHELLMLRKDIMNYPGYNWNIPEISRKLNLSPGYFQLLYKKKFGTSCMDDVIQSRIRKAKDQLSYTRQSISEIAYQCGYRNVEHFNRQFHHLVGMTPGDFRKTKTNLQPQKDLLSPYRNIAEQKQKHLHIAPDK